MGRPKKDKFSALEESWRDEKMSRQNEDINSDIVETVMNLVALEAAKALDTDLQSLQEQVKVAREVYTEGKKSNLLKIEFLIEVLRSRGLNVPGVKDFVKKVKPEA